MSSDQRRALQVLVGQMHDWQIDMNKFIAVHGEHMNDECDAVETSKSIHVAQKVEHALDERFRAIVNDLEVLLQNLLGTTSQFSQFVSESATVKPPLTFPLCGSFVARSTMGSHVMLGIYFRTPHCSRLFCTHAVASSAEGCSHGWQYCVRTWN